MSNIGNNWKNDLAYFCGQSAPLPPILLQTGLNLSWWSIRFERQRIWKNHTSCGLGLKKKNLKESETTWSLIRKLERHVNIFFQDNGFFFKSQRKNGLRGPFESTIQSWASQSRCLSSEHLGSTELTPVMLYDIFGQSWLLLGNVVSSA